MTDEEFERAIEEALDGMPEQFLDALDNIAIVMQDEPDDDQIDAVADDAPGGTIYGNELLGLFGSLSLSSLSLSSLSLSSLILTS